MTRFGQVLTAMITPFDDEGALDVEGSRKLAKYLLENGNDGLVIAGTTGESPTLTHDEQIELISAVVDAADGAPVIAGTGSNDMRAAIELTERATTAGADGILSVTPYYNRPSQAGLLEHFRAVAASTDLPVMLYDIPGRTGRKINTETLINLAQIDNIVALKDAAGNPAETARVIAEAPQLDVYSGDDGLTLPLLSVGAVGVVGVATHWCGVETKQMVEAHVADDTAKATKLNQLLLDSWSYETGDLAPNPVPTKAIMRIMGLPGGQCRLPMGPEPEWLEADARKVLSNLGRAGF